MKEPKYKIGDIVELDGYKAFLNLNLGRGIITHCNFEVVNTYYLVDWEKDSAKNTFCFEHNLKKAMKETKFKKGDIVQNSRARGGIIRGIKLDEFGNPQYFIQWPNGFKGYSIDLELEPVKEFAVGDIVSLRGRLWGKIKGIIIDIRIIHTSATNLRKLYVVEWPNGESSTYNDEALISDALQFEIGDKVIAEPTRPFLKGYKDLFGIIKSYPTVNSDRYLVSWFRLDTEKYVKEEMMNGDLLVPFRDEVEVDDKVILKNGDIGLILRISSGKPWAQAEEAGVKNTAIKTFLVLHSGKKDLLLREDFYLFEQ
jgi:hypothetical protein